MSKEPFIIQPPQMHWEIGTPQEQILDFVRSMRLNMGLHVNETNIFGWPTVNKEAQAYVNAYRTVEKHIEQYMPFWDKAVKK